MKLAEYRKRVNQRSGLALDRDTLNAVVNDALRQVSNEQDWPWLRLTVAGTWTADATTLAMPADAKSVVFIDNGVALLTLMTPAQMATRFTSSDRSRGLAVEGRTITPYPVPATDDAYTLHYVAYEKTLDGDGEEPLIPDEWSDAVVHLACSLAHDRPEGDEKAGARYDRRYRDALKRMRRAARSTRGAQVPRGRSDVP